MGWLPEFWALIRIARPFDTGVVIAGSLIGWHLAGLAELGPLQVLAVTAANGLLFAASMMFNDWHDVAEDSVNKPHKPIPSGKISAQQVLCLAMIGFLAAIGIASMVDLRLGVLALGILALSIAYTLRLKSVPFVGNTAVAVASAYPLWCWIPAAPQLGPTYLGLTLSCIVFRLGAEVVKTAEDCNGDSLAGIRTVATTRGIKAANRIGSTFMCAGLLLCWIPVFVGQATTTYGSILALASLVTWLAWTRAFFFTGSDEQPSSFFVRVNRITMGLMALACGFGLGLLPFPR